MVNARATPEPKVAGVDEINNAVRDTNATAHRSEDRLGRIEDRLGDLATEVAVLKNQRSNDTDRWKEINEKLDDLGTASKDALSTLEQWATIRRTLAWVAGVFWTISLALGAVFGWFYHELWSAKTG